ncbi:hypothetical protein QBC42DRAFT_214568 [Cladorrhinum samala]|uniref:AB hydrolase-1 domain-containing protein n=1 Tax=Cladorrhinum samala TaxID=585594 RepID=A0AAV9HAP6_9PEZI|nr:hypothetical protein QBC42DRAFT_214568 [Cladorrhinum samala]
MKKTLLLVFIHGFKGDDQTFGHNLSFPPHLQRLLTQSLPNLNILTLVYPTYDTRGDLTECVSRFTDWLLNKVIDLEVASGTPSPTIDPSVHVILVGHSMGGIVAAETAISLASEQPIHNTTDETKDAPQNSAASATAAMPPPNSLMFPYIQGVLAFDTPFLGISPGVVAHNAESHYVTASTAISQLSGLASLWGGAATTNSQARTAATTTSSSSSQQPLRALPAPPQSSSSSSSSSFPKQQQQQKRPESPWGKWSTLAMAAGAVGAVAAGGAAAYLKRDQISQSLSWATSHLEFVGCLARKEELRRRVAYMLRLNRELGVGFGNLYTRLGDSASATVRPSSSAPATASLAGTILGNERTFCVVPTREQAGDWRAAVNNKAGDEITAHVSMFEPKENPGYERLANDARDMITSWLVQNDWYKTSCPTEAAETIRA